MMTENFENVNHLVLNFYPDGYSIAVKLNEFPVFTSETILETARISYEETSLLDYIENEELPPLLAEMIDSSPKLSQYKIWHNGCLILEVRDKIDPFDASDGVQEDNDNDKDYSDPYSYRSQNAAAAAAAAAAAKFVSKSLACYEEEQFISNHKPPSSWRTINGGDKISTDHDDYAMAPQMLLATDTNESKPPKRNHFILLKPNNLSITYDVLNLTGSKSWSTQDRLQLESQIVLHNSPNLSLDPEDSIPIQAKRVEASQHLLSHERSQSPPDLDTNGNRGYSKLNLRQSPHKKPRLKDIYMNRHIKTSCIKSNGGGSGVGGNSNNNKGLRNNAHPTRKYNLYHGSCNEGQQGNCGQPDSELSLIESLPPELMLHQFVAARRKAQQNSLPNGPTPRFHRYKMSRS